MFRYVALKKNLENNGFKQKFVAEKAGIQESVLSEILNGKRKCSLEIYAKLCLALRVPFGEFIETTESLVIKSQA